MSPSAPDRDPVDVGVFMRCDPNPETATRQGRARRAAKDRELAVQVRRARIDRALAARERAVQAGFREASRG